MHCCLQQHCLHCLHCCLPLVGNNALLPTRTVRQQCKQCYLKKLNPGEFPLVCRGKRKMEDFSAVNCNSTLIEPHFLAVNLLWCSISFVSFVMCIVATSLSLHRFCWKAKTVSTERTEKLLLYLVIFQWPTRESIVSSGFVCWSSTGSPRLAWVVPWSVLAYSTVKLRY